MMKLAHTLDVPDELFYAARVSSFMEEGDSGRWRLRHFSISRPEFERKVQMLAITSDRAEQEIARAVPPGDYVTLQRRMTVREKRDSFYEHFGHYPEDAVSSPMYKDTLTADQLLDHAFDGDELAWIPIMSDTPAEILEHGPALLNASGRVLITGLGLGCLPHALLTKPEVESIHIIEIDPEVIALTGHYLIDAAAAAGVELAIHQGSATEPLKFFEEGERFDYVWHDIWSHISDKNLSDDTAEHGISYRRLKRIYAEAFDVGETDAWALPQARAMRMAIIAEQAKADAFVARLKAASLDEQVVLLRDSILRDRIRTNAKGAVPDDFEVTPELRAMLDPSGGLDDHIRRQITEPGFWEGWEQRRAARHEKDSLDHPNRHLEGATS
jgi:hypothetical protein